MLRCWKTSLVNITLRRIEHCSGLRLAILLTPLGLITLSNKNLNLLYVFPLMVGVLVSGSSRGLSGSLSEASAPNSRMKELAIKNPRLWEEIERLVVNERLKIARDLHERVSESTHTTALVGMEACRERLLRNDSASAVQLIQELKATITDSISKMRKYINHLRLNIFSAAETATIADLARQAKDATRIPRLQQEIKKLILNERNQVARDLHDEVIQNLATILIGLQLCERLLNQDSGRAAKELNSLEKLALDSDQKLRELSYRRRPREESDFSLVPALQSYVKTFNKVSSMDVSLRVQGRENLVPRDVRTNLMQIIKEAMANVIKHAGAQRLDVRLCFRPGRALALITDDGRGFDPEEELARAEACGHLGLLSMRERATVFGGSLTIEAERGQGSRVFVDVPFDHP